MSEKISGGEKPVNEKKKQNKASKFSRYSRIPPKRNAAEAQHQRSAKQQRPQRQKQKQHKKIEKKPVRIAFLGGLNEVGKNMTLYEYGESMFLVDCGLAFPDADLPGVDLVLPDFSYVEKNIDKIKGVVVTHGHEDHIGGLAYLLKSVNIPIYSTKLTIGLIDRKSVV